MLIIITCILFLVFAFNRIIKISKKTNDSIIKYFNKGFQLKYIWIVLLVFIVSSISYKLILKLEFVHLFGFKGQPISSQLSTLQSWIIIFLTVLYYPIIVLSEEIYFRCYLFEIQYLKHKNYTWIVNGFSWSVYHIFTSTNLLAILPTCLLVSYVYQKKRNVWITIAIHFFINFFALYPVFKSYLKNIM
jgi:membrane protease YdiL (CAAX protease family)